MSIRLDPRRVQALKHLAGDAGLRPGDLVRRWVEERIDAERVGPSGQSLEDRVAALEERLAALAADGSPAASVAADRSIAEAEQRGGEQPPVETVEEPAAGQPAESEEPPGGEPPPAGAAGATRRRTRASAVPSERVALHDEMIAVIRERGPMPAAELAAAITERGRYAPPRSGKPLDAAMVSQRVSNPTYRARFTRSDGRIGLAE